jgi:lipoprotein signal peptidase
MAVLAGTAMLGIGLDQATKALVVATREGKPPIRIVGQVLTICVTRNSGAAFGSAPAATGGTQDRRKSSWADLIMRGNDHSARTAA